MKAAEGIERYGVVGCSFREAPARVRGRLAFAPAWTQKIMQALRGSSLIDGIAFVSTCNRNEIILSSAHPRYAVELVRTQLLDLAPPGGDLPRWEPYRHVGREAARHVLRVASSLDSLAIGEREISAQLRRSLEQARRAGQLDKAMNGLSRAAQETSREVHEKTQLGARQTGMFALARKALAARTEQLARPRIAVLGLGEIGLRTARRLAADRRYDLVISSRQPRTRAELGNSLSACVFHPWERLDTLWPTLDGVVLATGAPDPIVLARQFPDRTAKPLTIVDLGIPPQAAFEVGDVPGIALLGLDALAADPSLRDPASAAAREHAEEVVDAGLTRLEDWLRLRDHADVLDQCRSITSRYRTEVLPDVIRNRFATLEPAQQRLLFDELHALLTAYSNDLYSSLGQALATGGKDHSHES